MKKNVWEKMRLKKQISFPVIVFLTSRLFIFSLALVFISLWPTGIHPSFLGAFSQWDGQWYLRILEGGYWYREPPVQSPSPFFPLFPLLGKGLTYLGLSGQLALFLVANFSCLGFFIVFWLLMKKEWGRAVANKALFYYALCPLSYVFSSLYAESLFLFLATLSFYSLRRGRFLLASFWAALTSATRPFGVMLVLPIIFSAWRRKEKFWQLFNYGWIASLGLGLYSLFLYFKLGFWAPFFKVQAQAWRRTWTLPWESMQLYWRSILDLSSWNPFFPVAVFDLIIVLLFTLLLFYSLRKLDFSYQLFVWPLYLLSVGQPWDPTFFLPSGAVARYLFQIFPLLGLLGEIGLKNKFVHYLLVFFFASLMGPLALAFFHGYWVE